MMQHWLQVDEHKGVEHDITQQSISTQAWKYLMSYMAHQYYYTTKKFPHKAQFSHPQSKPL
jgi:hypothetical protein